MANVWALAEGNPLVVDAEMDAKLGINEEGLVDACTGGDNNEVEAVIVSLDVEMAAEERRRTLVRHKY